MFDANDYNLEELSRKAAEDFSDETLIPSWKQLEKKLDIELPVRKKRRTVFVFWILFAALLGSFLYIANEGNRGSFDKKRYNGNIAESQVQINVNSKQQKSVTSTNPHTINHDSAKQINQFIAVNSNNEIAEEKQSKETSGRTSLHSSLAFEMRDNINKTVKKKILVRIVAPVNSELLTENKEDLYAVIKAQGEEFMNEEKDNIIKEEKIFLAVDSIFNEPKLADSLINNKQTVNNTAKKNKTSDKGSHSFTIAAIAGTNINSVSFNKPSKAGFDYGFLVGYKLSPKFEIKTGLIFSRKYFTTTGKNISFDSAKLNLPSYTNINLEDATGYCRFVEIPVMLYYSFPAKSNTSFYAGAGFSINKMRMEKIHYIFLVNSNTVVERSHAGAYHNADGYSTSVTSNISFGLKQKLSRQWSLGFEPYLKIPLTKVNDSDLKLTTFGISASLIYNLPNKKKK